MEDKKPYNHIFRKIAIMLYIVSFVMIFAGIIMSINGMSDSMFDAMNGSGFDDPFFDNKMTIVADASSGMSKGVICSVIGGFGMFIATVFMIIDFAKSHTLRSFATFPTKMVDKLMDTAVDMKIALDEKMERVKEARKVYCPYCGGEIAEDERKCPNCGANKSQPQND